MVLITAARIKSHWKDRILKSGGVRPFSLVVALSSATLLWLRLEDWSNIKRE